MALVLAIIGGLVYSTTDSYQAYAARSNGNPSFKITLAPDCEEGDRTSKLCAVTSQNRIFETAQS